MNVKHIVLIVAASSIFLGGCKKTESTYIYEVNREAVYQDASQKQNVKTATEFIAIAYTDVFGESIDFNILEKMTIPYLAFGDKPMVEDLIIRNFLADPSAQIPTDSDMRADLDVFIGDIYLKFYNRNPNEFERWQLKKLIESDADMTPEVIYYAILTSDEYRHY